MRIRDKVAVVTGANRGIGRACAEALVREGAKVFAVDVLPDPSDWPSNIHYRRFDVGLESEWKTFGSSLATDPGRVDILVCAAGIAPTKAGAHDVSLADWDAIVRVNQTGVLLGMRMALDMMLGKGALSIVNISSIWGQVGGYGAGRLPCEQRRGDQHDAKRRRDLREGARPRECHSAGAHRHGYGAGPEA
jgi:NAD(P)-dependent dehydrogenase (short-subunit alcohol dehydrogenase family)